MLPFQASHRQPRMAVLGWAFAGLSVMRIQSIVIIAGGVRRAQAQASSIVTLAPLTGAASPSIACRTGACIGRRATEPRRRSVDRPTAPDHAVPDAPHGAISPSIIALGEPAPPANEWSRRSSRRQRHRADADGHPRRQRSATARAARHRPRRSQAATPARRSAARPQRHGHAVASARR